MTAQPRVFIALSVFLICLAMAIVPYSGSVPTPSGPPALDEASLHKLQARYRNLSRQLVQSIPQHTYVVVDTARNHLYVKRQQQVILDAVASTGSGTMLDKPDKAMTNGCSIPRAESFPCNQN